MDLGNAGDGRHRVNMSRLKLRMTQRLPIAWTSIKSLSVTDLTDFIFFLLFWFFFDLLWVKAYAKIKCG